VVNILLDAPNWQDAGFGQPPSYWNGTTYDYIGDENVGKYFDGASMQYEGTVNAGDFISLSIKSTSADLTTFVVSVNGSPVFTQELATNTTYTFQQTFAGGEVVSVSLGVGDFLYSQDAILTPALPPPPPATPGKGFVLATGDDVSPASGMGTLTTLSPPTITDGLQVQAAYVRTPQGIAAVFFGVSPVLTMQLPEDVGEIAYLNTPKQKYTWRSKKFVFPGMTTFGAAKVVHSCQGGGVKFRLFVDCCCVYQTVVRGCVPFRLPAQLRGITAEIELSGCSRVTEVRLASSIRELMGDE
jgi:hypothetical protein